MAENRTVGDGEKKIYIYVFSFGLPDWGTNETKINSKHAGKFKLQQSHPQTSPLEVQLC